VALFRDEADFTPTFAAAGVRLGLPAALVEKDYWLTQVLRGLAEGFPDQYIFKGGTSLSKGFKIIQRFSEDVDLIVRADGDEDAREAFMEEVGAVAKEAVVADPIVVQSVRGKHRTLRFNYARKTASGITYPYLRIEMGFAGGDRPLLTTDVTTLIGDALTEGGQDISAFADLAPVSTPLLDPGRTLVEKLSLLHSRVAAAQSEGQLTDARLWIRHYYDVHCLLLHDRAPTFCRNRKEFLSVVAHSEEVSRVEFPERPTSPRPADGFAMSPAFAEDVPFAEALGRKYAEMLKKTYWGPKPGPDWTEVRATVRAHAELL
jgi:hypothetical protein